MEREEEVSPDSPAGRILGHPTIYTWTNVYAWVLAATLVRVKLFKKGFLKIARNTFNMTGTGG